MMSCFKIRHWPFAAIALCATFFASRVVQGATGTDGFAVSISEGLEAYSSLSSTLLNQLTLVGQDRPQVSITNTSTEALITSFTLTMENSQFRFGSIILPQDPAGITLTGYTPGATPGLHAGAGAVSLGFSGFAPNLTYNVRTDVDRAIDNGLSLTNYRQAFASGNDPSQWATIDVVFSDGQTLHELLRPQDISGASPFAAYSYFNCINNVPPMGQIAVTADVQPPPVPEPGTFALSSAAVAGTCLWMAVRRRRKPPA